MTTLALTQGKHLTPDSSRVKARAGLTPAAISSGSSGRCQRQAVGTQLGEISAAHRYCHPRKISKALASMKSSLSLAMADARAMAISPPSEIQSRRLK
jgi:hypothetical protein